MVWRKWLVRSLVFSLLGGFLAVGYLYQHWTNPAAVRRQVLAKLRELFPGAEVTLDTADLRVLGGIALNELRLTRKDDPDKTELACLPSAVLYHDKAQLLNGTLAFRKVLMPRLRLRIFRDRQGGWNLSGILAPRRPGTALPTLVIQQGTLVLDDQQASPGSPPLEISDVNLTLLNDPLPLVTFEGTGKSELVGNIHLHGTWQREANAVSLTIEADQVPVGPALAQRLRCYFPECAHATRLEGNGAFHAQLHYRDGLQRPYSSDMIFSIHQGKLSHEWLPLPLDQLEAQVRCREGLLTVEKLTARAGAAQVCLSKAWIKRSPNGPTFEAHGQVHHLDVTDSLFTHLPEKVRKFQEWYHPEGLASLDFHLARDDGQWQQHQWKITAENMRSTFWKFRYPLERVRGSLDFDVVQKMVKVTLTAFTGTRPVEIRGTFQGEKSDAEARFFIHGKDIPLDDKLLSALPPLQEKLARSFRPRGLADIDVSIIHLPGSSQFANHYVARIHHAAICWKDFPYALQDVAGVLDIEPTRWVLRDFQGRHRGGVIRASGYSYPLHPGAGLEDSGTAIEISGSDVALDEDLKQGLAPFPGLVRAWSSFQPTGQMNFTTKIGRLPKQPQDLDVTVGVRGCTILPTFFPYAMTDLTGQFHFCKGRLELTAIQARHGESRLRLPSGHVLLPADGEVYADLTNLRGEPLVPDNSFKQALPGPLQSACRTLGINDPMKLETRLVVSLGKEPGSRPIIFWDGLVRLDNARLQVGLALEKVTGVVGCRGRHNGTQLEGVVGNILLDRAALFDQPFEKVHCHFNVAKKAPDVVVLELNAPVFGGKISGEGRVELTSTLRYQLNLTASEIKLEEFSRHNRGPNAQLSGLVDGKFFLEGKGTGTQSLEGHGSLNMPQGRLYNLPPLVDLLKILGLRRADRTAFEQAHADFKIQGDQIHFNQLELMGNVVSLHGLGDMKLDGTDVRLDFIPVWGRIEQVMPPVLQPIPSTIGKNLLKIEVRGKIGKDMDLHFHKKPIPGLFDPLLQMRDRVVERLKGP